MAALTWRDVAAPSFGGASQAQQYAGASVDRALSGLSEGLKQFATEQQAGVDSALLGQALQIQDPNQLRQKLADGSLLAGVDLTRVSPKVLQVLDNRVGTLLNQKSTEQGIANAKTSQAATQQNIDFGAQDQTRKTQQQALEDAARPELARQLGLTGPLAALDTKAQQQIAQTNSGLASAVLSREGQRINNATGSFNLTKGKNDYAASQDAIGGVADILSRSATTEDLLTNIEQTKFKSPQAKLAAIGQIEKITNQRLYSPTDAAVASTGSTKTGAKGATPAASSFDTSSVSSPEARDALVGLGRTLSQNNSKGTLADVEANLLDKRSAPEVAQEVAKLFPEVDHAKLSGLITEQMSKNPNLSAADVASALKRSTTSNWLGSTRFSGGLGVDDKSFASNLRDLNTGKADYMSSGNQIVRSAISNIKSADAGVASAEANLSKLRRLQKSKPNIDISGAEDQVTRSQQALDDAIARYRDNPALQPVYIPDAPPPSDTQGIQRLYESGRTRRGGN